MYLTPCAGIRSHSYYRPQTPHRPTRVSAIHPPFCQNEILRIRNADSDPLPGDGNAAQFKDYRALEDPLAALRKFESKLERKLNFPR